MIECWIVLSFCPFDPSSPTAPPSPGAGKYRIKSKQIKEIILQYYGLQSAVHFTLMMGQYLCTPEDRVVRWGLLWNFFWYFCDFLSTTCQSFTPPKLMDLKDILTTFRIQRNIRSHFAKRAEELRSDFCPMALL